MTIGSFQYPDGSHSPLSNFYSSPFILESEVWPTVEHYYQAMKSLDPAEQEAIRTCGSPGNSKRMGRQVTLRPDWEAVKLHVMRGALALKFPRDTNDPLSKYLLDTGDALLVEGNYWHDKFWGVHIDGDGLNWLGHLLMARRAEIRGSVQ